MIAMLLAACAAEVPAEWVEECTPVESVEACEIERCCRYDVATDDRESCWMQAVGPTPENAGPERTCDALWEEEPDCKEALTEALCDCVPQCCWIWTEGVTFDATVPEECY